MALSVRHPSSPSRPAWPRFARGWLLAVLLAGSCLNPQPDPFPQVAGDSAAERQGPDELPLPAEDGAGSAAPLVPEPAPQPGLQAPEPAAPAGTPTSGSAEAPATDAGADAGADADAGTGAGPLVGGD